MEDVGQGQVIVVGKIKLTPPLHKGEQDLGMIGAEVRKNRFLILTADKYYQIEGPPAGDDLKNRIEAVLDKTYFTVNEAQPFYYIGGIITMSFVSAGETNDVYFPAAFKVSIHPGDRAVYVGTLHYYRDEFNKILKVGFEDEYEEAHAVFVKKFGTGIPLRKALLTTVRQ
jgi:hypothetical protein